MRFFATAFSLFVVLASSASLSAKGVTTKITISSASLSGPIDITDDAVLTKFQVWSGPGVFHGRGPIFQDGGTVVEETEGFIIDWSSGVVAEHPSGLPHYEVAFYVSSSNQPAYVVFYEHDSSTRQGCVYLPGQADQLYSLNSSAMSHGHGFEGNWLHASSAWQNAVVPLIARAAR